MERHGRRWQKRWWKGDNLPCAISNTWHKVFSWETGVGMALKAWGDRKHLTADVSRTSPLQYTRVHLWVHLWGQPQRCLTENGRPTLNLGWTIPWAGVLDQNTKEPVNWQPPSSSLPLSDCGYNVSGHPALPLPCPPRHGGLDPSNCEPNRCFFKLFLSGALS